MSETVQNLVNAIKAGNAMETENAFHAAMQEKLAGNMEDMHQRIAQSMFNQPEEVAQEEQVEEPAAE
jgi:thymidine phosphorylase